ncbi:hypothetical protein ACFFKE_13905 [Streptomyces mutabilis]|nr:hypothetical protein [Streptomyces mutabilis]
MTPVAGPAARALDPCAVEAADVHPFEAEPRRLYGTRPSGT